MFYVRIDGIEDEKLQFLGFTLISEDDEWKLYRDYRGTDYVVHKLRPFMLLDDLNDAQIIQQWRGKDGFFAIEMPPK